MSSNVRGPIADIRRLPRGNRRLIHPVHASSYIQMIRVATIWFAAATCALAASPQEEAKRSSGEKPKPKITISKETTYITEPLRPDGYPDYVAALNQRMSEGVTPENNAAVLLQRAFGPGQIPENLRRGYFKQLGIEPLPETGDYLVSRAEVIKRWRASHPATAAEDGDDLDAQFEQASEQPWKPNEHPIVAEWLKINEKPLRLVVEASRRPRQYFPIVLGEKSPLIACLLPHDTQIRDAAVALAARAMLNLGGGTTSDAWHDSMACHRLARLTSSGPFLIDTLVGYAVEGLATSGDAVFFHRAKLSRAELTATGDDLRKLRRFPEVSATFDTGERFIFLDAVQRVSQEGLSAVAELTGAPNAKDSASVKLLNSIGEGGVDWDVVFQTGNRWYDRLFQADRIDDPRKRRQALQAFENDLHELHGKTMSLQGFAVDFLTKGTPSNLLSPRVGAVFVLLLMPAMHAAQLARDRIELVGEMDRVACALAMYRSDHGSYPAKLDAIVPEYIAEIPDDIFTDKPTPIRYRREGEAYAMWTVHLNGIDDNGRGTDDDPSGDDYVLRPLPMKSSGGK